MKPVESIAEVSGRGDKPEILFWVGCAGSFDPRAQKVTRAFCELLQKAEISFAILGKEEQCTGDPARRAGNEFVFQMLALQNIQTLNAYSIEKIVTTCPHCFNILKNEYPQLGGNYEVIHHTQLLKSLLEEGKIKVAESKSDRGKVTYHDSCYLGRANQVYEAPRDVLNHLTTQLVEMERNRAKGLCCGAGGGQMFKEDEPGDKRINIERTEEALRTGANSIVVNCPFCLTMMTDGVKAKDKQDNIMVYDLSEMILKSIIE